MKTIKATEALDYYDGIEIFSGVDEVGRKYLGLRSEAAGDYDRYMVVAVIPEQLHKFRRGMLDLRELMLDSPDGAWYMITADMEFGEPMPLEAQSAPLHKSKFLPMPGFTLPDLQEEIIGTSTVGESA